jgi:hypothetical protein
VNDAAGDGRGHGERQERAREVEDGGDPDRYPWPECPGRDGRRHRVACVVEAVREVEAQRRDDDEDKDQVVMHAIIVGYFL